MSATLELRVLDALPLERRATHVEIARALGEPSRLVRSVLADLRRRELVVAVPLGRLVVLWRKTPEGAIYAREASRAVASRA